MCVVSYYSTEAVDESLCGDEMWDLMDLNPLDETVMDPESDSNYLVFEWHGVGSGDIAWASPGLAHAIRCDICFPLEISQRLSQLSSLLACKQDNKQ